MEFNKMLKEIAVIKTHAASSNSSCMAFLSELLPCDTGLEETVYELSICFDKKPTLHLHFRKVENAITHLEEYLEQNVPKKGFIFFNETGLEE